MKLKKTMIFIIIPILLEVCVFNFVYISNKFDKNLDKDIIYTIEQLSKSNWEFKDNALISNVDPILEVSGINMEVKSVDIILSGKGNLPYIDIFSIKTEGEQFSGDNVERVTTNISGNFTNKIKVNVNKFIAGLRIDLADEKGLELDNVTIVINPSKLKISYARLITMLLILLTSKFLFALQRNPKYNQR